MIRIKVKQPGLFFSIPNRGGFRTPAEIDVDDSLLPFIESMFRKNGIVDYTIGKVRKKDTPATLPPDQELRNITLEIPEDKRLLGVSKRLDNIEDLLKILLNKKDRVFLENNSKKENSKEEKKNFDKEEPPFIPTIDSSGFVLKGDSSKVEERSSDILSKVNALIDVKKE